MQNVKLKDLVIICYGKNQKQVEVEYSDIPILGTGGIIGYASKFLYDHESVLIGRKGTINMPFYINKPFWTIDTLFYTKINESIVIPKYLYYLLCTIGLDYYTEGAAVPSLTTKTLYDIDLYIHDKEIQQHIVNTIGSVDDLIENYQKRIDKIAYILTKSIEKYSNKTTIDYYHPIIIKSGINIFNNNKTYLDTSSIDGINNISANEMVSYDSRPSRANMQPIDNSVWFAKMKGSYKNLIITENDIDLLESTILSTGFLGIKATKELPMSLLTAFVISKDFNSQKDLNSVGTTMAGINNETFMKINVPLLSKLEINDYDKKYIIFVNELSILRRKINVLKEQKSLLLSKYF